MYMNYEEQVLNLLNKNNMVTTKETTKLNIPKIVLTRLVKKNKIERLKRGVYISPDSIGDEYYALLYGASDAVYSYFTALYFYDLCERVPLKYDVTVKRNYSGTLIKNKNVKLHYVDENKFELGQTKIKSPQGKEIKCYDVERCLCDLISNKDNLYFEYVKYAFVKYYREEKHDTFKLYKYAKKLGIEEQVKEFMEALL